MSDPYSFPEDAERLPEGFKRIAYDSDTMKFTFRDCKGHLYQGEAGAEYGILTPISTSTTLSSSRPNAFSSDTSSVPPPRRPPHKQKSTFNDILPPNLITTPSLSEKSLHSPSSMRSAMAPRQRFVKAVRQSALPKMQAVVLNLRRSLTSHVKRPEFLDKTQELERDETRGLVRSASPSSGCSDIPRPASMAASRPHPKYPPS